MLGIVAACVAGIAALALIAKEELTVTTSITQGIPPLSADLVRFISAPAVLIVLARVTDVQLTQARDQDLAVQTGRVNLEIVEPLSDGSVRAGNRIVVPAKRLTDPIVRVRNAFDHWNVLPLLIGDLLILAVQPTATPDLFHAVAARQVPTVSSAEVQEIRQACMIEHFSGPPEAKAAMLDAALTGSGELLTQYSLGALQQGAVLGRAASARLIAATVGSDRASPERRLQLGEGLIELLDPERNVDETNVLVVRTIGQALATEGDRERRSTWATYLAAVVLTEFSENPQVDRQARAALIQRVQNPGPREMIAILSAVAKQDPEDEQVRTLLRAWRSATSQE